MPRDDLELVAEELVDGDGDDYWQAVALHQRAEERLATARRSRTCGRWRGSPARHAGSCAASP